MKKMIIGLVLLAGIVSAGQLTYTTAEVENAVRLTLTPGHLAAQLDVTNSPISTSYGSIGATNNLEGVTSLTTHTAQDFTFDVAATNFYYSLAGAVDVPFVLTASISFSQNASNAELEIFAMKNGSPIDGIYIQRTLGTASQKGVAIISGHFTLSENDTLELAVRSNKSGDFIIYSFATDILEENQ